MRIGKAIRQPSSDVINKHLGRS